MAEDCVNQAATLAELEDRPCLTQTLSIHGAKSPAPVLGNLACYGSDAPAIQQIAQDNPVLSVPLHSALPYTGAEIVWAVRHEMARSVEDVLARRTRSLFLNAKAAIEMAPCVAEIMANELHRDNDWQKCQIDDFLQLAKGYTIDADKTA